MLIIYRSNRAEWLAKVLSQQLLLSPPEISESLNIIVNTWPTSRWLGETIASSNGISAHVRFPFPGTYLKQLVEIILCSNDDEYNWDANHLVWPVLDLLPVLLQKEEAAPLQKWLSQHPSTKDQLNKYEWQLAESISRVFDDYTLYRPELMMEWLEGSINRSSITKELPVHLQWQPILFRLLHERIKSHPFGLKAKAAIELLKKGDVCPTNLPNQLNIFGISSLAPVQIELIQALSGLIDIKIFLLTPCRDLWQRHKNRRALVGDSWNNPHNDKWLLESPRLEASLGRMGSEFQQLLEGSGEYQLGEWQDRDLFALPINIAKNNHQLPSLLEQLQQQLISPEESIKLRREEEDNSLIFIECPGQRRQVEVIRDYILQCLSKDKTLEPRDVIIMTPQVELFAPLIASVFNDITATNVNLPWKVTDKSQRDNHGLIDFVLGMVEIASTRLTSSRLDSLLSNKAILKQQNLTPDEVNNITHCLQKTGFRWGLDATDRDGDETHSLCWCLDRWLIGLILPTKPGLAPQGVAPFSEDVTIIELSRWWYLLSSLSNHLDRLRHSHKCHEWIEIIKSLLENLFGDGGEWSWEYQLILTALEEWKKLSNEFDRKVEASVVLEILTNELSIESGRFGHRSGKITISALEPMRAIPHRVIILMGVDEKIFPRFKDRPGFDLLEQRRLLGDPRSCDQDRYVLLEAIMSARKQLIISWNSRDEKTGEKLEIASPIQQWLEYLKYELNEDTFEKILVKPPASPLDRENFIPNNHHVLSCDTRNLKASELLEKSFNTKTLGLGLPLHWSEPTEKIENPPSLELIKDWITSPQLNWLEKHQLKPREWFTPTRDLDELSITELVRHKLIKKHFENLVNTTSEEQLIFNLKPVSYPWKEAYLGQGVLPPKSANTIETEILNERWTSLQSTLLELGPCKKELIKINNDFQQVLWAGNSIAYVEIGKIKSTCVMRAWLNHILICMSKASFDGTFLITRSGSRNKEDSFELALHWEPLQVDKATFIMETIKSIVHQGQKECWPIPPESGWAFANSNQSSQEKCRAAFAKKWNGSFNFKGEREKADMKIVFGSNIESSDFTESKAFKTCFETLYTPIIESLSNKIR